MNLRDLSAGEMLSVSAVLLDETGQLAPLMQNHELLQGPFKVIQKSHNNLLRLHEQAGSNEKRIRELTTEMTQLDSDHDRMARGIYGVLEAFEALTNDPAEAQEIGELLTVLFPQGRSIGQRTYREQAGVAKQVQERLNMQHRLLLNQITAGSRTLLQEVEDWLNKALLISRHEAERAMLNSDDDDGVSAGAIRQARITWIQAVQALLHMLPFAGLSERDQRLLLANIEDASKKAAQARRRAQTRTGEANESSLEPTAEQDEASSEPPEPAAELAEPLLDSADQEREEPESV